MIRFGNITEFDAATMRARVQFPEDEIVSDWLSVLTLGSGGDKYARTLTTNEHVVVWVDEHADEGVVLGSIYDDSNEPSGDTGVEFANGLSITIQAGKVIITKGTTTFEVGSAGVKIAKGVDTLQSAIADLITQIALITVTTTAFGTPSSPPINAAAISAITARIVNILQ